METEIKKTDHSFAWFNTTQFFGALNDNIFKLLVVYFLTGGGNAKDMGKALITSQALTVLPFLFLLAYAGRLADRYSKRNLIVCCKAAELIVMLLAVVAFWTGNPIIISAVLLLMYTQSAFFAPNKYGIICELVDTKEVTRANGRVQAFTYTAVLLGMVAAPWVSKVVEGHYVLAALACVLIAVLGLAASIPVKTTRAAGSQNKASVLFFRDIIKTIWSIHRRRGLLWAVIGSAYFTFVGVSLYFCVIPYGMETLGLSKEDSTYLFIFGLIGIAMGSLTAGRFSRKAERMIMIPLGTLILGVSALTIGIFKPGYWPMGVLLFFLGGGAGLFVVPVNTYIQTRSPDRRRGEVVAASEFLSWVSHLIAIILFSLLTNVVNLSSAQLFIISGIIAVIAGVIIWLYTSKN